MSMLEQIRQIFNPVAPVDPVVDPATLAAPLAYKLQDGTEIMVDKMEVGGKATINGVPAMMGDYVLEDGTTLTVDEAGTITVVNPAAAALDPNDMGAKFSELQEDYTAHKTAYAAYAAASEQRFAKAEQLMSRQSEAITMLTKAIDTLMGLPQGNPPADTRTPSQFSKVQSREDKLEQLKALKLERMKSN